MSLLKKATPPTRRAKNSQDRKIIGNSWAEYHKRLDQAFPLSKLQIIPRAPRVYLVDQQFAFKFLPASPDSPLTQTHDKVYALLQVLKKNNQIYPDCNRRYVAGNPKALHMGFYEQNLPKNPNRTWKLYEATNKPLLLALKPILQHYSTTMRKDMANPSPCPKDYGLFGTIFTTIVVNNFSCQWHVDPQDKLTIIFYFGKFTNGELGVAPNFLVPIQECDAVILNSVNSFHRAFPFVGERFSISAYSKKTTKVTQKGTLTPDPAALWALSK